MSERKMWEQKVKIWSYLGGQHDHVDCEGKLKKE